MKPFLSATIFVIVTSLFITFVKSTGDVLTLTGSTFDDIGSQHKMMLVKFFAPWCGHCKKLAPEFEAAATILKHSDTPVALVDVDCTVETELCQKYSVSGYPTLKVFKQGVFAFDYEGGRTADTIVSYMELKAGPASKEQGDLSAFTKVFEGNDLTFFVVGCFGNADAVNFKTFMDVAAELSSKVKFLHSFDKTACETFKIDNSLVIRTPKLLQSKFEDVLNFYRGSSFALVDIVAWVKQNMNGLAGVRTVDNAQNFEEMPLIILYYALDYVRNPKGTNYWRNRFMKVSKEMKESKKGVSMNFAVSNFDTMRDFEEFGFDKTDSNNVFVAAYKSPKDKYRMEGQFTMDAYKQWLSDFLEGKIERYIKSEKAPSANSEAVKVVVATTFDDIVNDPSKDVLIEFYAPWCGHCQQLEPKYNELAQKLEGVPNVVIAKIDATANDIPAPYEVSGFPTIYFAPKNGKGQPVKYEGEREVKALMDFLADKVPEVKNMPKTEL